jgi:hypothetical protein
MNNKHIIIISTILIIFILYINNINNKFDELAEHDDTKEHYNAFLFAAKSKRNTIIVAVVLSAVLIPGLVFFILDKSFREFVMVSIGVRAPVATTTSS